jgi:membrane protein YqaA with SNARE-associated domain
MDSSAGVWGLFISAFISSTLAPGGSEAVLAYLVANSEHSPLWLLCVATAGNTLGALTTWGLGMLAALGYPVEKFSRDGHPLAIQLVRRWGAPALLLSWLPVVGDGMCLVAGWLRFPFLTSLLAIVVGKAARYAVITYAFL